MINFFLYLKKYLNYHNVKSAFQIFFYSLLKKNTKYPKYLLNFEKEASKYFGGKYALSFSNGTTACNALMYACGLKKDSKILISKLTFPSVISSILRIGATPIYLDFDKNLQIKDNYNEAKILNADFFLITHAYGIPQDINIIKSILNLNPKLILLEDISHSQGAIIDNKIVGNLGHGSFMSMQGDKAISAGEGGLVITNSDKIYNRLIYLSHLNRKFLKDNTRFNDYASIGFLGKGRMSPLGAITATNDIRTLEKRNKKLRIKFKIIYNQIKNFKNFYLPNIDNFDNTGGFHYGFPFFCEDEKLLSDLKKRFQIVKYNWPKLDLNESFNDPNKFLELLYNDDLYIENVFQKSNDLRDYLFFFSLNELTVLSNQEIKKRLILLK